MRRLVMMRVLIPALAFLLIIGLVMSGALLLRSCGLRLPFSTSVISVCRDKAALVADDRLAVLEAEREELTRSVASIKRKLASVQCTAELPEPPPPPEPEADPEPEPEPQQEPEPEPEPEPQRPPELPSQPDGLDRRAFEARDVAVLEGCWELDSRYQTRDIQTGAITRFNRWSMCFGNDGHGRQVMQATNGTTCQGGTKGTFDNNGALVIDDEGGVECSDGGTIFRRITTCNLDDSGRADCRGWQPDTRHDAGPVGLRRAGMAR